MIKKNKNITADQQYSNITFVNMKKQDFLKKKLLYKFMTLENALNTLNKKKLWLSNPTIWKDPFEKRFVEAKYDNSATKSQTNFPWQDRVFCMCLTQTYTSEAYWKIYSNGVGIEFTIIREKLLEEIENYCIINKCIAYIGCAEYMKTADIKHKISAIPFTSPIPAPTLNSDLCSRLLLLKRNAYKYEDEVRIMIVTNNKSKASGIEIPFQCYSTDLIDTIILDPQLEQNESNMLKTVFENTYSFKSIITSKGTRNRVLQSRLYNYKQSATIKI